MVKPEEEYATRKARPQGNSWVLAVLTALGIHALLLFFFSGDFFSLYPWEQRSPQVLVVRLSPAETRTPDPSKETKTQLPPAPPEIPDSAAREISLQPSPGAPPKEASEIAPVELAVEQDIAGGSQEAQGAEASETMAEDWKLEMPDYPAAARRFRQTGSVVVEFRISVKGAVFDAKISRSSGYGLLDRAALETVSRKWIFPPQPRERLTTREFRFLLTGVE